MYHEPVLLQEPLQQLQLQDGGIYVDATYGGGGHSSAILQNLIHGKLIAFDQDESAMKNRIMIF